MNKKSSSCWVPSGNYNIQPTKALLKMTFIFSRWDMLASSLEGKSKPISEKNNSPLFQLFIVSPALRGKHENKNIQSTCAILYICKFMVTVIPPQDLPNSFFPSNIYSCIKLEITVHNCQYRVHLLLSPMILNKSPPA